MEIEHKKNTLYYLAVPMVSTADPEDFLTGETVGDTAFYKDGAGSWSSLAITDTFTEILSTGLYEIDLTAAELNHDIVIIKITSTNAADSFVRFTMYTNNIDDVATDLATVDGIVDNILVDTGTTLDGKIDTIDGIVDNILTDTGTTLDGAISTIDGKIDTIDGIVDNILTDTGTTLDGKIDTIDGNVDSILTDTGTTLPATLTTIEGKVDTVDGIVDNILVDTGTTLDGKIDTIDTNVDSVLTDTGTTLPGTLTTIEGKIDTIDGVVDNILVDTETSLAATLSTVDGKVDTIDGIVDAILVDTGTTLPATLSTMDGKIDTVDTVADAIKVQTDKYPEGIKKNTELANFCFTMVDETDGYTLETGKTVTEEVSKDGASYENLTNAASEIDTSGTYKITLAAADVNCDAGILRFSSAGCRTKHIFFKTET